MDNQKPLRQKKKERNKRQKKRDKSVNKALPQIQNNKLNAQNLREILK